MNYSSNEALVEDPNDTSQGAFPVCIKVFTKPGEQTFLDITSHPEAKAKAAYIWVFIVGTLSALISSLVQFVTAMIGLRAAVPDIGQIEGLPALVGVAGLLGAVCSAPLAGLFSIVSALMAPLYVIPFAGFLALPILLGVGIYVLYLQVAAIRAVHRLGWGKLPVPCSCRAS